MSGGYRTPLDPRPLLKRLESDTDIDAVWQELWDELHHQGDVGEASYAAVPFIVESYRKSGVIDWNAYAIVTIIELARNEGQNPDVPQWIAGDYFAAIRKLAEIGLSEILQVNSGEDARAMLGLIAVHKDLRVHGRFLVDYSDEEMMDMESKS